LSASGATDGRPHHQKPSFATLAAVVTDFRNEICHKQTSLRPVGVLPLIQIKHYWRSK